MGASHHGRNENELEILKREHELQSRFVDQVMGAQKQNHSRGKLNSEDEGDLALMVAGDKETDTVMINFGKPVEWIGLPPQEAVNLAQLIIKQARSIAKDRLDFYLT